MKVYIYVCACIYPTPQQWVGNDSESNLLSGVQMA